MIMVTLGSLDVGSLFHLSTYDGLPLSGVYRVVGCEGDIVNFVSNFDMFSPVFSAINYLMVYVI